MLKAIKNSVSHFWAVFWALVMTLIMSGQVRADEGGGGGGPDLFSTATSTVQTNVGLVTAFLSALLLIPVAFFVYRLVTRALGR